MPIMSGLEDSSKFSSSAFLFRMLWKFMIRVRRVWSVFTGAEWDMKSELSVALLLFAIDEKLGGSTLCVGVDTMGGVELNIKE